MTMLADRVDTVIGVDTHKLTHTAAVVTPTSGLVADVTIPTDAFGAKRVLAFAREEAAGRGVWAIEGSGSYGSGLITFLLEQGEWVVEINRPARPARRDGAKSGDREAIRVLVCTREGAVLTRTLATTHLHGLVANAPEGIRNQLRKLTTDDLLERCAWLPTGPSQSVEHRTIIMALRSAARRALACEAEASDLESALEVIVERVAPELLARPGVGVMSAARILNA